MNLLIQGLQKAGVQTSIKKFSESMKSMEKTTKAGGMDAFRDGMENMANFATGFQPIAVPFQILMTQFAAGTTESSIKLMVSMMELLESPAVQLGTDAVMGLVNGLIDGADTLVTATNDLFTSIENADLASQNYKTAIEDTTLHTGYFNEKMDKLTYEVSKGYIDLDAYTAAMKELNDMIARWEAARVAEIEKRKTLIEEGRLSAGGSVTAGGVIYDPDEYFLGGGAFG